MLFFNKLPVKKICRSVFRGKNRCVFILGFALFLAALCLLPGQSGFLTPLSGGQAKPEAVQVHDDLLRFHVKAHNSPEDQEVKIMLPGYLPAFNRMSRCRSSAELAFFAENSPVLESVAREILQECGFAYDAMFPWSAMFSGSFL